MVQTMAELKLLTGKTRTKMLNNHKVVVVLPRNPISYKKGVKELEKLVDTINKKKS